MLNSYVLTIPLSPDHPRTTRNDEQHEFGLDCNTLTAAWRVRVSAQTPLVITRSMTVVIMEGFAVDDAGTITVWEGRPNLSMVNFASMSKNLGAIFLDASFQVNVIDIDNNCLTTFRMFRTI